MTVPEHRIAICRRCRRDDRRASGAADAETMLRAARGQQPPVALHCRLSQCLNCCDGGHTVRVEYRGREIALIGARTEAELSEIIGNVDRIAEGDVPDALKSRVFQRWEDGRLVWHRNRDR